MKSINKQKHVKQITYIVIILILCNFIFPNYIFAVDTKDGGDLVNDLAKFLCFVPDTVINCLQYMFVSTDNIDETGEYKILYAPGAIFAGQVPAFDINFIGQTEESNSSTNNVYVIQGEGTEWILTNEEFNEKYSSNGNVYKIMQDLIIEGNIRGNDGHIAVKLNGKNFNATFLDSLTDNAGTIKLEEILKNLNITWTDESSYYIDERITLRSIGRNGL